MQVFLPYKNFYQAAKCLDRKRLNKQVLEIRLILKACVYKSKGWINHLIVKMWRGSESLLWHFGLTCCNEYFRKTKRVHKYKKWYLRTMNLWTNKNKPEWFSIDEIFLQYQANLFYKNFNHYSQFNWDVEPDKRRFYFIDGKVIIKK